MREAAPDDRRDAAGIVGRGRSARPSVVGAPDRRADEDGQVDDSKADVERFRAASQGHNVEGFMAALGPGAFTANMLNEHCPSGEALLFGAAEALREEYKAIVEAGFIVDRQGH